MDNIGISQGLQNIINNYNNYEFKAINSKENVVKTQNDDIERIDSTLVKEIEKLNKYLDPENAKAIISRHETFGDTMVKIINKNTKEVLLEIPPQKILDMVAKICELAGLKINKKA